MIRPATSDDLPALSSLADAIGLFQPHELDAFLGMMSEQLEGHQADQRWIVDDKQGLRGAAYYAPEVFAEGVWNLYFIAVHPDQQGHGCGSALLRYVEHSLREKGERLLLVETSGTEPFKLARAFYQKNGYDEEARIRDFYQPGDDKVIFRKTLQKAG